MFMLPFARYRFIHRRKGILFSKSFHSSGYILNKINMINHIYRALWLLLCFLANCYAAIFWSILQLKALYYKSYHMISCNRKISQAEQDQLYLERCKSELKKIPRHLNIVIGPHEGIAGEVLSRIVFYALNMDIHCISFYDTRSFIYTGQQHLAIETIEQLPVPKIVCSKKLQDNRFVWSINNSAPANGIKNGIVSSKNGVCNGTSNGACNGNLNGTTNCVKVKNCNGIERKIEIALLSPKDGRPLITEVCQELHQLRGTEEIQKLLNDRTLLIDHIDMTLKEKLHNLPDPELSIIFNRNTCTFGLIPWQTRFTEFHTIETGQYFNVETFAKVLYRYSRCEQRWGK